MKFFLSFDLYSKNYFRMLKINFFVAYELKGWPISIKHNEKSNVYYFEYEVLLNLETP